MGLCTQINVTDQRDNNESDDIEYLFKDRNPFKVIVNVQLLRSSRLN